MSLSSDASTETVVSLAAGNNQFPIIGIGNETHVEDEGAAEASTEGSFYDANDEDDDDESSIEQLMDALIEIQQQVDNNNVNNNVGNNNNDNNNDVDVNVNESPARRRRNNNINIDTVRRNIVSDNTNKSYNSDLTHLLDWIYARQSSWLTQHGMEILRPIFEQREGESMAVHRKRKVAEVTNLIENSFTNPILHLHLVTPSRYMHYLIHDVPNTRNPGTWLSPSSYGNKRSAFNHLFRLHNRTGFPAAFNAELGILMRGFKRQIAKEGNRGGDRGANREGKEPMSVALFKAICRWFLNYGTRDGIFAHCYLVLTWNLACRAGNTGRINFADMSWADAFDAFSIQFSHTKTDQLGEEAKYARHVYSNALTPLCCPLLSLSMYFTCCFNTQQQNNGRLFPGVGQDARFSGILGRVLEENAQAVELMGYSRRGAIGTHSIRKGAVSYLASLPGGPPAASVCIRAGWTMGRVKDIYMRYVTSGDQFVGRCLCLLSVLRTDFAVSPVHFLSERYDWIEPNRRLQFPMIAPVVGLERLTRMCFASIIFHQGWLTENLQVNHVF
jgi:hypothetical protein